MKRLLVLALVGCAGDLPLAEEGQPILGAVSFGSSCDATERLEIERAMHYGRVASMSHSFRACLEAELPQYIVCSVDPPVPDVDTLLNFAHTVDALTIECTGAVDGRADYTGSGEGFRFN